MPYEYDYEYDEDYKDALKALDEINNSQPEEITEILFDRDKLNSMDEKTFTKENIAKCKKNLITSTSGYVDKSNSFNTVLRDIETASLKSSLETWLLDKIEFIIPYKFLLNREAKKMGQDEFDLMTILTVQDNIKNNVVFRFLLNCLIKINKISFRG